ncbi:hypothetical protein KBC79_03685 [Candidatus Woesebacteria bacterium]|nr:hypothetical protein [Candidatus Woesebacteria bacterium]
MDSIRLTDFVGLPSALGWSHVATISASTGARSIVCFAVSGIEASAVGHEIVAIIRSTQLESEQNLYDLIISLNTKTQERSCRLSVAAGFLEHDRGSWITYDGVIGLQRNDRFGRALTSVDLQMRTGAIRANDIFVLATTAAAGMLDDIDELFQQGYQFNGVESSLDRLIRTQPQQDRSALALIVCLPDASPAESGALDSSGESLPANQPALQTLDDISMLRIDKEQLMQNHIEPNSNSLPLVEERNQTQYRDPTSDVKPVNNSVSAVKIALSALWRRRSSLRPILHGMQGAVKKLSQFVSVCLRTLGRFVQIGQRGARQLPWESWFSSRKIRLIAIGVAVVIAIATLVISGIYWRRQQSMRDAEQIVSPYKAQLQEIQLQAQTDPLRAQSDLVDLASSINDQLTQAPSKTLATNLQALLLEMKLYQDVLKGEQLIRSLPVLLDLQTVVPGFIATVADGLAGNGFYVDSTKKIAILVKFDTKETRQFDLAAIGKISSVSLSSSTSAIILGDGIYSLDLEDSQASPVVVKPVGDSNKDATLIGSYSNYVYIFNPEKRNLYRYLVRKDGYSDPVGWLLSPLGVAADTIYSLKVDGDVWLSTKDGQVEKFSSGRVSSFVLSNLEQPFEGPTQLYTSENDQYIYVFVPTQNRVVVLTKDGTFVKQIKSEILSGALAVVADEAAGQLYAVSGSTIYQAKL